jgi:hypothetical protein
METTIQRLNAGDFFQFINGNQLYKYIGEDFDQGIIYSKYVNEKGQYFETDYNSRVLKI